MKSLMGPLLRPLTPLVAAAAMLAAAAGATLASEAQRGPMVVAQAPAPAVKATDKPVPGGFTAEQRKGIEAILKDYLIANPEVMLEIQTALEARMEELQAKRLQAVISSEAAEIFRAPGAPVAGNPKGDVTLVEFFDYNCGYCKRAFSDVAKLVEKDQKVKVLLLELPILSKGSEEASRVALAAKRQGKYWEVHRALLTVRGQLNEQTALATAEKLGLDMKRVKADMADAETTAEIKRVRDLAQRMGIQGTPHFLVGDRPISGAPQDLLDVMTRHVADIRKGGGCKVC